MVHGQYVILRARCVHVRRAHLQSPRPPRSGPVGGSIGGPGGVCRSVGSMRADWPARPRRAKEGRGRRRGRCPEEEGGYLLPQRAMGGLLGLKREGRQRVCACERLLSPVCPGGQSTTSERQRAKKSRAARWARRGVAEGGEVTMCVCEVGWRDAHLQQQDASGAAGGQVVHSASPLQKPRACGRR